MAIAEISTELVEQYLGVSDRRLTSLPRIRPNSTQPKLVLASDVEGPFALGDFITEGMARFVRPEGAVEATPTHGQIIYTEGWEWFTKGDLPRRRGSIPDGRERSALSLSQEGTDTIFTLPALLAAGATYQDLERLTLNSKITPGADQFLGEIHESGIFVVGITTAPQEPYRAFMAQRGLMDPNNLVGSPYPMEETRQLLLTVDPLGTEMIDAANYLNDCYEIIDDNSEISDSEVGLTRTLNQAGQEQLHERIRSYFEDQLGVSYDRTTVNAGRDNPRSLLGYVIQQSAMVGDRAKAAVAQTLHRSVTSPRQRFSLPLVTMGDGANDAEMLRRAPISIGLNGADAAKAAKIGVVTDDMRNVLPIFHQILKGERDPYRIATRARAQVGDRAIIHMGGADTDPGILAEHKRMKKWLRGDNITY